MKLKKKLFTDEDNRKFLVLVDVQRCHSRDFQLYINLDKIGNNTYRQSSNSNITINHKERINSITTDHSKIYYKSELFNTSKYFYIKNTIQITNIYGETKPLVHPDYKILTPTEGKYFEKIELKIGDRTINALRPLDCRVPDDVYDIINPDRETIIMKH